LKSEGLLSGANFVVLEFLKNEIPFYISAFNSVYIFFKFIDKTIYTGNVWVYVLSVGRRRIKGQRKRKSHEKDQSIFNNNKLRVTPQYYT
jgi:hypothetical protein